MTHGGVATHVRLFLPRRRTPNIFPRPSAGPKVADGSGPGGGADHKKKQGGDSRATHGQVTVDSRTHATTERRGMIHGEGGFRRGKPAPHPSPAGARFGWMPECPDPRKRQRTGKRAEAPAMPQNPHQDLELYCRCRTQPKHAGTR